VRSSVRPGRGIEAGFQFRPLFRPSVRTRNWRNGNPASILAAALCLAASLQAQQTVFKSGSDLVTVDVSVRASGVPVSGLAAVDFALTDNGVRQQLEAVAAEAVPVDVTLLVDTSGSVIGNLDAFKSDMKKIVELLRPDDRVRLLTFADAMTEVFPMQPPSKSLPFGKIKGGGATALYDALVFALAHAPRPDRRHLVFLFTDGDDNASFIGPASLAELASRAEAVLHVVLVGPSSLGRGVRFLPPTQPGARALSDAAVRTGGVFYPPSSSDRDVVASFKQVFDDFRGGYVLRYTATGVPRDGWHDIVVTVTKPAAAPYTIRARKGYFGG
jgi:Ca-activated chloride channel family protein